MPRQPRGAHHWICEREVIAAATATTGLKVVYVAGSKTAPTQQVTDGFLTCPMKFRHPISGFFDGGANDVYLSQNRPDTFSKNVRRWSVCVTNTATHAVGITAGVVCAQQLRAAVDKAPNLHV